jgi:hypothetical protein
MTIFFCLTKLGVVQLHSSLVSTSGSACIVWSKSSKLLLVLASTVVLGFGLRRDPRPNLCSFQDRVCIWKWDPRFDQRKGLSYWEGVAFVAVIVPALTQQPGKGTCTLWTRYTFCAKFFDLIPYEINSSHVPHRKHLFHSVLSYQLYFEILWKYLQFL